MGIGSFTMRSVMQEEMNPLEEIDTYNLVELVKGRKPLKAKWAFNLKGDDKLTKHKGRFVIESFNQKNEIDFDEITFQL